MFANALQQYLPPVFGEGCARLGEKQMVLLAAHPLRQFLFVGAMLIQIGEQVAPTTAVQSDPSLLGAFPFGFPMSIWLGVLERAPRLLYVKLSMLGQGTCSGHMSGPAFGQGSVRGERCIWQAIGFLCKHKRTSPFGVHATVRTSVQKRTFSVFASALFHASLNKSMLDTEQQSLLQIRHFSS
jgi:hypothetical protein